MSERAPTEMTAEGLEALRLEIDRLEGDGRAEMAKQIKTAREFGDLSENAEYHAAKEAQAHLETRILRLRDQLSTAEIVEVTRGDVVGFGSTVEVEDEASGRQSTYQLVSAHDAAPAHGRLSVDSPVAAALRGRRTGEVVEVQAPRGARRLRVVSVS